MNENINNQLCNRFRGFYPVVIDVETSGFNAKNNAILEIAAITVKMTKEGYLESDKTLHFHITPFKNAILEPSALAFNGIDPYNPLRNSIEESKALNEVIKMVSQGVKANQCKQAIIVAHNASFDHSFIMAAIERNKIKRHPFHSFSTFDTAALSGLVFGQTVLAKACEVAEISFDQKQAHGALYDTQKTAELFCKIVNRWKLLGGWPL